MGRPASRGKTRRFVAGLALVVTSIALLAAGRVSRGTSPCPKFIPVALIGTLSELRVDDAVVSGDDAKSLVVPQALCLAPPRGSTSDHTVTVSDCYVPSSGAVFVMVSP